MIILILLYISFFSAPWNTLALPANPQPLQNLPTNHLQSIFIREESRFDSRSIYGILWSCLSTIFACTWIAAHPNIPAPGDSKLLVFGRRMAIMGYTLLAPEMVILWAGRQHYAARSLVKKYGENRRWTGAHAFLLIMGGFTLHEGGKPVRVLVPKELEELSSAFGGIHCIPWSFYFATSQERWAWRISAIVVSGLPTLVMASMYLLSAVDKMGGINGMDDAYLPMWRWIMIPMAFLYIMSRIILLVLPFVALRALPFGAYVQLDWVSFLPHI